MNQQASHTYDPARAKRIARASTPVAIVIAFVLSLRSHESFWLVLPVAVLAGVANYWFWRASGYLASHVMRGPQSSDRDSAA